MLTSEVRVKLNSTLFQLIPVPTLISGLGFTNTIRAIEGCRNVRVSGLNTNLIARVVTWWQHFFNYSLQVSTHPPTSIFVHLNVIGKHFPVVSRIEYKFCRDYSRLSAEAKAEIIGPPLRYLTPDSTLRLICKVLRSTEAVAFLFWYHDERMINYDMGITITTEAGTSGSSGKHLL